MKKRSPLLVTLLVFAICGSLLHAAEVLTQQDVIKLLELKIPEQTIIEKVKASGTSLSWGQPTSIDSKKRARRMRSSRPCKPRPRLRRRPATQPRRSPI